MNILFRPLFTLEVTHSYYEGRCCDFRFIVPESTAAELKRGRLMARELDGRVHVLFEAHAATGLPRVRADGITLRFGLRLANPYFAHFTAVDAGFPALKPRFTNAADAEVLAAEAPVRLVGEAFAHALGGPERPATATLRTGAGTVVATRTVEDATADVSFTLGGWPAGAYTVAESRPNITREVALYRDAELAREDAAAVVEVRVDEGFYTAPPQLEAAFTARAEVLSYYVVARKYTAPELEAMQVTEANPAVPLPERIVFDRFTQGSFPAGSLDPGLVAEGEPVVLFRSHDPLPRRERGRRRIQLSTSNDEVLVANLPQPGPEQARADVFVHLSKP